VTSYLSDQNVGAGVVVVTDSELASLNIKDLNKKLKSNGFTKEDMEKFKAKRRTLKNRQYATE